MPDLKKFASDRALLLDFAAAHTECMFNEPGGLLRRPYLDPAGCYSGSLWDWDSFWASSALFGIADIKGDTAAAKRVMTYAEGSLLSFFDAQGSDGAVPIMLQKEHPDFFECLRPGQNIGKPVHGMFAEMLHLRGALGPATRAALISGLRRLAECRIARSQSRPTGLFVWNNDTAIGVDDNPAAWARPDNSCADIYLNSLVYADWAASARFCAASGDTESSQWFGGRAEALRAAVRKYCFDKRDGSYYSVDVQCVRKQPVYNGLTLNENLEPFWAVLPLKVASWTVFLPMWAGIASPEEAERMVLENLLAPGLYRTPWGVRSLAATEPMYSPEVSRGNPSNWLGPVWIITQYMVWKGLRRYGYSSLADALACDTVALLADDIRSCGAMHEYYSPETGRGICGEGFVNWNLLACLMTAGE